MLTYVTGDLFASPAKVLVNAVNTVGVMGKGIAKTFKQAYPEMFLQYQSLCEKGQFEIGQLWIYRTHSRWILNFPTKIHWRQPSKPEYIEAGLKKFVANYSARGITSIAFPRLGCGNGELDWKDTVEPLMKKYLDPLPIDVFVYHRGHGDEMLAEHKKPAEMRAWLHNETRALPFDEMWSDLIDKIGPGVVLRAWSPDITFTASADNEYIRFSIAPSDWATIRHNLSDDSVTSLGPKVLAPGQIQIPRISLSELWQAVRGSGFCTSRIMPAGMDTISGLTMGILSLLDYMKPVSLDTPHSGPEKGLQLIPSPSTPCTRDLLSALAARGEPA